MNTVTRRQCSSQYKQNLSSRKSSDKNWSAKYQTMKLRSMAKWLARVISLRLYYSRLRVEPICCSIRKTLICLIWARVRKAKGKGTEWSIWSRSMKMTVMKSGSKGKLFLKKSIWTIKQTASKQKCKKPNKCQNNNKNKKSI